ATFTQIYYKEGLDLSTVSGYITTLWTPNSASDWRTEMVDLAPYLGENVQFRFVNINGYGNSTFIDNINVSGVLGVAKEELNGIKMYPNPANSEVFINFKNVSLTDASITLFNSLGQRLQFISETEMAGKSQAILNVSGLASGVYFVKIKMGENTSTKKLIVQ
ncbi:MAG TPA: peptidase S8, partial [Aequorivita sp.]|nr:peptidase S8 [Aequorivita sp.]